MEEFSKPPFRDFLTSYIPLDVLKITIFQFLLSHEQLSLFFTNKFLHQLIKKNYRGSMRDMILYASYFAASYGHHTLLLWIRDKLQMSLPDWACSNAAHGGFINTLQLTRISSISSSSYSNTNKPSPSLSSTASRSQMELMCAATATGEHLSLLRWAIANKHLTWTTCTSAAAARIGNLEALKIAIDVRDKLPLDKAVCAAAARGGHLHILKWLREEQAMAWDQHACVCAIDGNHTGRFFLLLLSVY